MGDGSSEPGPCRCAWRGKCPSDHRWLRAANAESLCHAAPDKSGWGLGDHSPGTEQQRIGVHPDCRDENAKRSARHFAGFSNHKRQPADQSHEQKRQHIAPAKPASRGEVGEDSRDCASSSQRERHPGLDDRQRVSRSMDLAVVRQKRI